MIVDKEQIDKIEMIQAVMKGYLAAKWADKNKYGSYEFKNFITGDFDNNERQTILAKSSGLPAKQIIKIKF